MLLDLTAEEARLLLLHLERHIKHVDDELVRTDSRSMQRDLALDERRLVSILKKLENGIGAAQSLPDPEELTIPRVR